eukprot:scaffold327726_cov14-Prasinocladus_malaysianus.AAC.1
MPVVDEKHLTQAVAEAQATTSSLPDHYKALDCPKCLSNETMIDKENRYAIMNEGFGDGSTAT